jgi:hypothetical protein
MGRTSSTARHSVVLAMVVGLLGAACGSSGDVDVAGPGDTASTTVITTTTGPAGTAAPDTGPSSTTAAAPTSTSTSTSTSTPAGTTTAPSERPAGECSAGGLVAPPTPTELGAEAAATYRSIADAAVACDYDALAAVAGDEITLSFGGHDDVADFLMTAETEYDEELLRILVQLLAMAPGYQADFDTWVWPTFWEDDEPATVDERTAIEAIYGRPFDEILVPDLGYINHRVGIDANGDWLFFVAGD